MDRPDDKELQQYFDGELSRARARKVRRLIEQDEASRGRLQALEVVQQVVRREIVARADEADFSGMSGRVLRATATPARLTLGERFTLWMQRRWRVAMVATAASLLVAVGLTTLLVLRGGAPGKPRNDAVIESLDVGPQAVGTIFTLKDDDLKQDTDQTTVIWVTETSAEGDN